MLLWLQWGILKSGQDFQLIKIEMNSIDKKTYFFFLLIIAISSIYIKFFNITNIFSEYDDIGVITLFKGFMGEKIININFLFFEKKVLINQSFFSNFENNFLSIGFLFIQYFFRIY